MKEQILNLRMKWQDNQILPEDQEQNKLFQEFMMNLTDGQIINVYFEAVGSEKSLNQLAMAHAMIRKLAMETGNTFDEMKKYVKTRSGINKSFRDCSHEELSSVIDTLKELYDFNGLIY